MLRLGLKLWSVNTDFYLREARRLYDEGVFDYVELYVVPETVDTLAKWRGLKMPFIIHNAHSMQGFNLAQAEKRASNRRIYEQSKLFADALDARFIIFHGGIDGSVGETAAQLAQFDEPRAVIENKPFVALPNKMSGLYCRGATPEELSLIMKTANCGFCLDFGHAICAAAFLKIEPYSYIEKMVSLKPSMFHLSDVGDMSSPYDAHPHLGTGELDISRLKRDFLPLNAVVSIETNKDSKENLDDFANDIKWLKTLK